MSLGAAAVEYGLLVAVIALVMVAGATALGTGVSGLFDDAEAADSPSPHLNALTTNLKFRQERARRWHSRAQFSKAWKTGPGIQKPQVRFFSETGQVGP